jgi:SAM-dependent methyltransferase
VDPAVFRPRAAEALNQDAFGDGYETEPSFWVRWFEDMKNRRYLANLRRAGVTRGRLLEVGVGTGAFLRAAGDAGFPAEGCDLSASLCRRVREATGITVHNVPLEQLPLAAYDVVAMHHVLEHVSDPVGFLRAARDRLKPGGVLHVAVPNVACWEAGLPGWNSYEPYHMLYFNRDALCRVIEASGCLIVRTWTFDPFSVWFLAVLRTFRPPHRDSGIAPNRVRRAGALEHAYRLAMVMSGALTWPLRWLQGRLGKGDELLMVARRAD